MHLPILTFHALDGRRSPLSFPPARFAAGMAEIAARGLRSCPLTTVPSEVARGGSALASSIAITFDDGYRSVYEHALPVLSELGFAATVFVSIGVTDSGRAERLPAMLGRERLSWSEMSEMSRLGISFGAHTLTHPDLRTLPDDEVEREMRESKRILEDRLGVAVTTFAYPFGHHDARACSLASRHFDLAVTDRLGLAARDDSPHALPRVETYYLRSPRLWALVGRPSLARYLALRNVPRRLRRWVREARA